MRGKQRILAFAVCLWLCLLPACSGAELADRIKNESGVKVGQTAKKQEPEAKKPVRTSAGSLKTADIDPLLFAEVFPDGDPAAAFSYPKITGLADSALQSALNGRIERMARSLSADFSDADGVRISVNVCFRYNDVLSIVGRRETVGDPDSGTENTLDAIETYTVDLRSGTEMHLQDLFAPDFDYAALLGASCGEKAFYLNEYGIHLVDADRAERCFGFEKFDGALLIADGCDPSLYTDPSLIGIALMNLCSEELVTESESLDFGRDNIYVYEQISVPSDFPDALTETARAMTQARRPGEAETSALAQANAGTWVSSSSVVWGSRVGDYYTLNESFSSNVEPSLRWRFESVCRVYDRDFRQLLLDDLFVPGYDFRSAIRSGLREAWKNSYESRGCYALAESPDGSLTDELLDRIIDGGSFTLTNDSVCFFAESVLFSDTSSSAEEPKLYFSPLMFTLKYSDIGTENLRIF